MEFSLRSSLFRAYSPPVTGQELREIRKKLGVTQAKLADLVGMTPNTIARQERDELTIREPMARLYCLLVERAKQGKRR